jgi:multidrug transporter EmrE-like cation transporter
MLNFFLNFVCALLMVTSNTLIKKSIHGIDLSWNGNFLEWINGFLYLLKVPKFWGAILSFFMSIITWFFILSKQNITTAYPLQISLVFTFTTISGYYFLNERLSISGSIGLCVILLGVFILLKS